MQLAQTFTPLNPQITLSTGTIGVNAGIPDNNNNGVSNTAFIPQDIKVERVEVVFDATHSDRGDLLVELVSPDGTSSILSPVRSQNTGANFDNWVFSSVRHWGETSQGNWTLRVSDRDGNGKAGTFDSWKLNIYGSNPHPPVANNDVANGFEEIPLAIPILANDTDSDGRLVGSSIQITSQPANGTLSINPATGVVTYTGKKDFFGVDAFSYRVADNTHRFSNVATVTITLENVNDAPVAVNDVGKTLAGPVVVDVLANDFDVDNPLDPASIQIIGGPFSGIATINPVTGAITYTPPGGFAGGDILSYTITDAEGAVSNVATVKFRVGLPVSLGGHVYIDNNGNGLQDPSEQGLSGVLVTLSKTDGPFTFTESVTTGPGGNVHVHRGGRHRHDLSDGRLHADRGPAGAFLDGVDKAGSHVPGFYVNDQFGGIPLPPGALSTGWTFAERGIKAEFLATYLVRPFIHGLEPRGLDRQHRLRYLQQPWCHGGAGGVARAGIVQSLRESGRLVAVGQWSEEQHRAGRGLGAGRYDGTGGAGDSDVERQDVHFRLLVRRWIVQSHRGSGGRRHNLTAQYRILEGPTTNYAYLIAAANKLGIAALPAEQLTQLSSQLAQGTSRVDVALNLWTTAENYGRRVDAMYQAYLHRAADAAGRAGFVNRLLAGAKRTTSRPRCWPGSSMPPSDISAPRSLWTVCTGMCWDAMPTRPVGRPGLPPCSKAGPGWRWPRRFSTPMKTWEESSSSTTATFSGAGRTPAARRCTSACSKAARSTRRRWRRGCRDRKSSTVARRARNCRQETPPSPGPCTPT